VELNYQQKLLHLRLKSCVQTVLEVHQALTTSQLVPDLEARFKELRDVLSLLDSAAVGEEEVRRVERATNFLLSELKPLTRLKGLDRLTSNPVH